LSVVAVSLVLAVAGVIGTRAVVQRREPGPDPHVDWALGLAALAPAWLVVFVALLGPSVGGRPPLGALLPWILSAAAALAGAIASEGALRARGDAATGLRAWRLGLVGFLPAWGIALIAYALR
jgi:hypothetical protein